MTRPPRLKAAVAGLALVAGLVVAAAAGDTSRAAAGTTGVSPEVYLAGQDFESASLSALDAGGASSVQRGFPSSITATTQAGPTAINSNATRALVWVTSDVSSQNTFALYDARATTGASVAQIASKTGSVSAIAMDPANPDLAYSIESFFNNQTGTTQYQIDKIDMASLTDTPWVTQFPTPTAPASLSELAMSGDGKTLYAGGVRGTDEVDVFAIPVGNGSTPPGSTFPYWEVIRLGIAVKDLAVSPAGGTVYATLQGVSSGGPNYLVSPNAFGNPSFGTKFATQRLPSTAGPLTVSPNGASLYVSSTSSGGNSTIQSFSASSGSAGGSVQVPIVSGGNCPSGGITGMAISPDGSHLFALGCDANDSATTAAYAVSLPGLGLGPRSTFPNLRFPQGPEDIAITPDQAPVASLSPASGSAGSPVTLNASGSNVVYGSINTYSWDFGDGNVATSGGPVVSHTYSSAGSYTVTLTETDSAGTSIPPAPGTGGHFSVDGPGQTPYRSSNPAARTTAGVAISPKGVPPPPPPTTTKPTHKASPTLVLNPIVGPPGTIVTVSGKGFPASTPITISWSVSTGSIMVTSDSHGNLPKRQLFILVPDVLGPRFAVASSTPKAKAKFLVVPGSDEPGGDNAALFFRAEGQ